MKTHKNLFDKIISLENLLLSWQEFRRGKRNKQDVMEFERNLKDNLFCLHYSLKNKTFQHKKYHRFQIHDPKFRIIHKAAVHDRILHHALYRILYPIFDKSFIFDSYSCRLDKGTHNAVKSLGTFVRKASKNYFQSCFALKCDIKKFFDSVDQRILFQLIKKKITNENVLNLVWEIISSFGIIKALRGGGLKEKEFH